ncbi:ISL3 family transposase [Nesterenkonia sphaerica]|uniref:ISL3 family transposase n=1 Tax=Nesterenkonia sphaerica TaxID=1804988 RepID=A0A5R9AN71_9MICC|nr:ISL3 family transposase [Nesterenkonia sphaerica]TLP80042.1 ISL3 family transposase [Nesterenkonia sphaerica]
MAKPTFTTPDIDSFCLVDQLGLTITGQRLEEHRAVLECRVLHHDPWCRECGAEGVSIGTVVRRLAHVPLGWRPTTLLVRVRRYRCADCARVWRQDTSSAAPPRAKLSRPAVLWALKSLVIDRMSVTRIAAGLGAAWHTVNDAVLTAGTKLLINDRARFQGVKVLGVDEHCWRHTGRGSHFVTVIIDLTPVRNGTGAARLLDMIPGRSKQVFKTWLDAQSADFRDGIAVVAMDGFTGFKTAAAEELPQATAVMDPFHVVALAGDALDRCRQRVQQDTLGHRGRSGDPLYGTRRTLRTGADLLTEKQHQRLQKVFTEDEHVEVEATWRIYQKIVAAYRNPSKIEGKNQLEDVIASLRRAVPRRLHELISLGRTFNRRAADILAYFDRPGTSNGPTEAINGRLEHLRGTALGFRNLAHYITRSLLDTGGFRPLLHPHLR